MCTSPFLKFSMQVSSHPLPSVHTPSPTAHTLSSAHKCLLACPTGSPLSAKSHRVPFPQGPWLLHTVCTHSFTQIPHRRLSSTSTAIQKLSPHSHFPSLSSSSLGPPGHPPQGPLSTPVLSQAQLSTVTHTHTRFPTFSHASCGCSAHIQHTLSSIPSLSSHSPSYHKLVSLPPTHLSRKWQPTPVFLLAESPWTEEPGGLQSVGLQRVGHD